MHETKQQYTFGLEFQTKILAMAARDKKFLEYYGDILDPGYMSTSASCILMNLVKNYYNKYKGIPTLDATNELSNQYIRSMNIDSTTALEITGLIDKIYNIDLSDADYVRDKAVDFGKNQALRGAILDSAKFLHNGDADPILVRSMIEKACNVGMGVGDYGLELFNSLEMLPKLAAQDVGFSHKVSTGWPTLDNAYKGGLGAGEIGIIIGGAGQGKSSLLVNLGAAAIENQTHVVYITHELSEVDVSLRFAARFTGMTIDEILNPAYYDEYVKAVTRVKKYKHYLRVKYMHPGRVTAASIRSYISRVEALDGVTTGLLCNDYADKLMPIPRKDGNKDNGGSRYWDLGHIITDLIVLGKDYKFPVWTASQLNREGFFSGEARSDNTADSFQKIMDADLVVVLQQTRQEMQAGKARGWIDKARRGKSQIGINWDVDYAHMHIVETPPDPLLTQNSSNRKP